MRMSVEENKALVQRFADEVINAHDAAAVARFCADDMTAHRGEVVRRGLGAIQGTFAMLLDAFPDARYTVDVMLAEGDLVCERGTMVGTHTGPLMGVPPTGRPVTMTVTNISRIKDGKIVEHWGQEDMLALLQQLGLAPAMGGARPGAPSGRPA